MLGQKDEVLQQLTYLADERASLLAERDRQLVQKQDVIQHLANALSSRDEMIAKKDEMLAQEDEILAQKDDAICQLTSLVAEKDRLLATNSSLLDSQAAHLRAIYSSRSWRLTAPLRALINSVRGKRLAAAMSRMRAAGRE